ncbi:putative inhibitor of MCP methylation, CheC [Halobacteroides halobius DSM 5150]|uniref:Putative inhibitor of MCP methylation, CheC n=1 Tax=Halobacteroides halobius (strain ATCC 35273 / DSM 5150 / MD-1) TaxID=748449 RepID=L0K8W0_HALHC|nr:chemotaxis protein CheX [Halobacteroides halobius]AGB40558.1 putative inhibitor of MCP methylation, CheC [Halobacteroides halobius DSM 5150]
MKKEYINPILKSTKSVLENMIQLNPTEGERKTESKHFTAQGINASIGVTGSLEGFIYFSMEEDTALNIVTKMSGMEINEFDDLSRSAIGELANIITGNSTTKLSDLGYQCDITPPSIAIGDNMEISPAKGESLIIPLHTKIGDIKINISLKSS